MCWLWASQPIINTAADRWISMPLLTECHCRPPCELRDTSVLLLLIDQLDNKNRKRRQGQEQHSLSGKRVSPWSDRHESRIVVCDPSVLEFCISISSNAGTIACSAHQTTSDNSKTPVPVTCSLSPCVKTRGAGVGDDGDAGVFSTTPAKRARLVDTSVRSAFFSCVRFIRANNVSCPVIQSLTSAFSDCFGIIVGSAAREDDSSCAIAPDVRERARLPCELTLPSGNMVTVGTSYV